MQENAVVWCISITKVSWLQVCLTRLINQDWLSDSGGKSYLDARTETGYTSNIVYQMLIHTGLVIWMITWWSFDITSKNLQKKQKQRPYFPSAICHWYTTHLNTAEDNICMRVRREWRVIMRLPYTEDKSQLCGIHLSFKETTFFAQIFEHK